jgi:hypothetical protein
VSRLNSSSEKRETGSNSSRIEYQKKELSNLERLEEASDYEDYFYGILMKLSSEYKTSIIEFLNMDIFEFLRIARIAIKIQKSYNEDTTKTKTENVASFDQIKSIQSSLI